MAHETSDRTRSETPSWQGQAAAEAMVRNSATDELLLAAIDRRIGGRTLNSAESSWADVEAIIDNWAELVRFRLCQAQERAGCVPPEGEGGV